MKRALRLALTVALLLLRVVTELHAHARSTYIRQVESSLDYFGCDWPSSSTYAYDVALGVAPSRSPVHPTLKPVRHQPPRTTRSSRHQRFTGKERDAETGLDLFSGPQVDPVTKNESVMLRYYSGAQGRFTSPDKQFLDQDPSDPQSWNLFGFVRNNPLSFFDLSGGKCKKTKDGFEGDCASPGDEKVTEGDKAQVSNVNEKQGSMLDLIMASGVPRYVPNDRPLPDSARKVLTVAYYRTAHDLGCAGMGFAAGDAGGAVYVSGQPNAGFRSPVSGRLVGGSKPFASGGASAGSSTLSGALRDALPQKLPTQVPTPVGGPGTGRAFSMQGSNRLGVVLGRWAPFVGAAGIAYGAYSVNACLSQ